MTTEERLAKLEKQVKALKKPPPVIVIPPSLDTPEFREAWYEWVEDKKERGKHLTSRAVIRQMRQLASAGPEEAVAMLGNAINGGWTTVFPLGKQEQKSFDKAKHTANIRENAQSAESNQLAKKIAAAQEARARTEWDEIEDAWNKLSPADVRKVLTCYNKANTMPLAKIGKAVKSWWWKKRKEAKGSW